MTEKIDITGCSILVVDDKESNRLLLKELLEKEKYKVRQARNGELGIINARKNPPDLIILDVNMPGMDGFEVCEELKADEITNKIPVIFASAYTDEEQAVKGFESGAVDYIRKPILQQEVLQRVKTHLTISYLFNEKEKHIKDLKRLAIIGEQASFLAHDAKNGMTPISLFAKQAHDLLVDGKPREYISKVIQASESAIRMLSEISDVARGEVSINKEEVFLPLYLEILVEDINSRSEILKSDYKYIGNIYLDKRKMYRVLENLVNNAKDAGAEEIKILSDSDKEMIFIEVQDNGPGVPEEIRDTFMDFGVTSGKEGKGTGLGLSYVLSVIDAHHGTFRYERGNGLSRMIISLPDLNSGT